MSFNLKLPAKDRATGRFMSRVHRALAKAVSEAKENKGLTQQQIADAMGVDKSVVSRILSGESNLTLKTIGDISWVLGLKPEVSFKVAEMPKDRATNYVEISTFIMTPRTETRSALQLETYSLPSVRKTGSSAHPINRVSAERANAS